MFEETYQWQDCNHIIAQEYDANHLYLDFNLPVVEADPWYQLLDQKRSHIVCYSVESALNGLSG